MREIHYGHCQIIHLKPCLKTSLKLCFISIDKHTLICLDVSGKFVFNICM